MFAEMTMDMIFCGLATSAIAVIILVVVWHRIGSGDED